MVGLWLLFSLIVGVTYKCNLKAKLIAPKIELPFSSVEELAYESSMNPAAPYGSVQEVVLAVSNEDIK